MFVVSSLFCIISFPLLSLIFLACGRTGQATRGHRLELAEKAKMGDDARGHMTFGEGTFDSLSLSSSSLAFHLSIVTANILDCGRTFKLAGGGGTNQIQKQASHVATAAEIDDAPFNSFIIDTTYSFRFSSQPEVFFEHGPKP